MGAPLGGAPTSEGAPLFALATAATGHAVIAVAFKLLEGGSAIAEEGFGSAGGGVTGGAGTGVDRRGRRVGVSVPLGHGVVRACVCCVPITSVLRWVLVEHLHAGSLSAGKRHVMGHVCGLSTACVRRMYNVREVKRGMVESVHPGIIPLW